MLAEVPTVGGGGSSPTEKLGRLEAALAAHAGCAALKITNQEHLDYSPQNW
jgi:hypothetical protein